MAVGRVEQVISIKGQDGATDVVNKVKASLDDLNKSTAAGFKDAAEKSGDLEKGLLGVRDLVGDLPAPVQKMADVFGGAEKILQIMPGPLGMVTAGIVAAGAAGYILFKNISETEAKLKLLGDARTFAFKDQLGLAIDEAVKLSQAIGDLPANIKVTDDELKNVVTRAKSLGLEGGQAAVAYAKALKEGPKALIEFEKQFGKLAQTAASLPDISKQLGLDERALNAAKQAADVVAEAATARDAAQTAQIRLNALQDAFNEAQRTYAKLSLANREAKAGEIRAQRESIDLAKEAVDTAKKEFEAKNAALQLSQRKAAAEKVAAEASKIAATDIAVEESKVGLAVGRSAKLRQDNVVVGLKLADIERQRVVLQNTLNAGLITEKEFKQGSLEIDVKQNQLLGADRAKQKADRAEAKAQSDKRKQQIVAEEQALAKLAAARAEATAAQGADDVKVYQARLAAIAQQEAADIDAVRKEEGRAKTKAAKIDLIRIEASAKVKKLQDEEFDKAVKIEEETRKLSEERIKFAADTVAQELKLRAQVAADPLTKEKANVAVAEMERQKELADLEAQLAIASEDRLARQAVINAEYTAKVVAFAKERQEAQKQEADKVQENFRQQGNALVSILGPASQAVAAYTGNKGLGGAINETVAQGKKLIDNWQAQGSNSAGVIGAVGNVAAAFVDGEREKAAILAVMEGAQAVASVAVGDIPGAIAHGAAAALYGSVAGGLIGGGASTAPSAGGGGFAAGGATAGTGEGGGGGPATTVINFNAPLGTSYEIGKSVVKAQKAAGASGWSPNMAMGV